MDASRFLAFLHQHTEHDVELRRFHNTDRNVKSRSIWTRHPDDVKGFLDRYDLPDFGVFFGVATRKNRSGDVNACLEVPALWIDCDGHRPVDELKSCFMPPSAIVESGGGAHAYWKLSEPVDVEAVQFGEHRDHPVMRALAGLKRIFNGDAKVVDIARVMRLPGTTNSKRDDHVVCTVIDHNSHEYAFEDIEDWISWQREIVGDATDPFLAAMEEAGIKPPMDIEAELDGMVYGENIHDVQLRVSASLHVRSGRRRDRRPDHSRDASGGRSGGREMGLEAGIGERSRHARYGEAEIRHAEDSRGERRRYGRRSR